PNTTTHITTLLLIPHRTRSDIHTLSLHDALPIFESTLTTSPPKRSQASRAKSLFPTAVGPTTIRSGSRGTDRGGEERLRPAGLRSEEHTSELQSRGHLVCRLLLEKKKKNTNNLE